MLSASDIGLIALTSGGCTAATFLVALLAVRVNRRGTIASQFGIIVVAAIVAIVGSTVAIGIEMYLSGHDLTILLTVLAIAAILSLLAASAVARLARHSLAALRDSARRLGDGEVVAPDGAQWKEFADLSSQLAETSERLTAARLELERLDATRRRFFAWTSHDLRTPLAGITALAEALEDGAVEDPDDYIRMIGVQARAMNQLVDDLFELSRIDSGTLKLRLQPIELRDLVSEAVADVRPHAEARDIDLVYESAGVAELTVDPQRFVRVVVNLLTNAIRYAPPGSAVLIEARRTTDESIELTVTDHGDGVHPGDLERMFEAGWRAGDARSPGVHGQGAGIGLAIVRGIVLAHGGEVRARRLDERFQVVVSLPDRSSRPAPGADRSVPALGKESAASSRPSVALSPS